MTYVFDYKIIPLAGLFGLAMIEVYNEVVVKAATATGNDGYYILLFVINMIYIAFEILLAPDRKMEQDNT